MRPLFRGEGCAINEAGISTAGNPLSRALDAVTNDHMGARQMREGYLAGMRPPMAGMGPGGHMLDPMGKASGSLDAAWNEVGPMRPPMPMGLGAAMPEQLRQHMQRPMGADMREAGFFTDGPTSMTAPGSGWAAEFAARPVGPGGGPGGMMMQRPIGPQPSNWAGEFQMRAPAASSADPAAMDAAFREAQMRQGGDMEAAFKSADAGVRPMGPMGPMVGPMPMMGMGSMMGGLMGMGAPPMGMGPMQQMPVAAQQAPVVAAAPPAVVAEAPVAADAQPVSTMETDADLEQAAQMVEMLRSSGNPKFANSQFVNFIDKVSKGDLQFKDHTVIDREGNEVDWDSLYDIPAATATPQDQADLEKLWEMSGNSAASSSNVAEAARLAEAFESGNVSDADLERLLSGGMPGMQEAFNLSGMDAMMSQMHNQDMWGEGMPPGMEQMWRAPNEHPYQFAEENPYKDMDDPLAEALRLLAEGRDREALLCLEAEVQRNPESSEGWRVLGELYAALDQDVEAIQCLRKGHEVDPYNLDSLLALGVSCTNELDQLPALKYLRRWVENHEVHQVLTQGLEAPPEYDYEAWRQQVTELFKQAAGANPLDSQVFVALGVMENINRNYEGAIQALATACRLRPNDHTVWNKLGATLANSGKSEQALVAYHQGLQLKPNYARSWSNLAIAHGNLGQHKDAARFYLSSLVLNPEATHIWNHLSTTILNMDAGAEEMRAIEQRDLPAASKFIDGVLDPSALPKPMPELPQPPDEILASIDL